MKDDKLEKEFDEYFKGVNTPDDITADAKKCVTRKKPIMTKFVKFACIAASFVLVFATSLAIVLRGDFIQSSPPVTDSAASPSGAHITTYGDDGLEYKYADAYSAQKVHSSLAFIKNLAVADNAQVESLQAGYSDNKLTLVKAEVSVLGGLSRIDTKVYVEYTDGNVIYSDLTEFAEGSSFYYRDTLCYLTESVAENGEPLYRLFFTYKGVKYYFDVTSSDRNAYGGYLKLIIK